MNKKIQTLMGQVAEAATERKNVEEKEKALKAALLTEMKKVGIFKEKTDYGSFTIKPYTKYTYSDRLQKAEEELKLRKISEVEQGVAVAEVTESLTFTAIKVK